MGAGNARQHLHGSEEGARAGLGLKEPGSVLTPTDALVADAVGSVSHGVAQARSRPEDCAASPLGLARGEIMIRTNFIFSPLTPGRGNDLSSGLHYTLLLNA